VELYLRPPNTPSWRGAQLKHRDNFTLTFTYCSCLCPYVCTHTENVENVGIQKEHYWE